MKYHRVLTFLILSTLVFSNLSWITIGTKNNEITEMDKSDTLDDPIWPMYGYNAQHTGKSPYDTSNNDGIELWKVETPRSIESEPIISKDGTLYVGSEIFLNAIDPNNLSLKWSFKNPKYDFFDHSSAISNDGTVYFGDALGNFYALNPDGIELWNLSICSGNQIGSVQALTIGEDNTIYAGTLNGDFAAIQSNGTMKWKLKFSSAVYSPAINKEGIIFLGSHNSNCYAIHPNGTILWEFHADCSIANPSVDSDGIIYAPGCSGFGANHLYALYQNGTVKWKFTPDFQPYGTIANYPAIDDDTIYINTGEGKLYALDKSNGDKKWSLELTESKYGIVTSPAIGSDGTLYVNCKKEIMDGSTKGFMYAITSEGEIKWESEMTCNKQHSSCLVLSCPVIGIDGTVYCGSWFLGDHHFYGYIHAFGSSEDNHPPSIPTVDGPSKGSIGTSYDFHLSAGDPEGDDVYYFIDWDEEEDAFAEEPYTGWIGPYTSGEEIIVNHTWDWDYPHQFNIRVKARDEHGLEGEWSTMKVIMPYVHPFVLLLEHVQRFFEQVIDYFQSLSFIV